MTKHKVEHFIRIYWPVVVALVGVSAAWGSMDKRMETVETEMVRIDNQENPLKIAVINAKIDMMMTRIGFNPQEIRSVEKQVKSQQGNPRYSGGDR